MGKILQNKIAIILAVVLSAFLVSCGSLNSGAGGGGSDSPHSLYYDDFNDNTLDPWTEDGTAGYSVSVIDGEVRMTAPTSPGTAWAVIEKTVSLSDDFVLTFDEVQQSIDNQQWRHRITVRVGDNNYIGFMDGDANRNWQPGWIIDKTISGVRNELYFGNPNNTAGVENVLTTMKIKRVGTEYTFSIIRDGIETVITTQDIPEFSSYSIVRFGAWSVNAPVDIIIDNFMAWADTSATTCEP
jgi:hypothetical protein